MARCAGGATLSSQAADAGRTFHLQAQGRFVAQQGRAGFAVDRLNVDGIAVPAGLQAELLAFLGGGSLRLDLSALSVPLRVTSVRSQPGMLTVEATSP